MAELLIPVASGEEIRAAVKKRCGRAAFRRRGSDRQKQRFFAKCASVQLEERCALLF